MPLDHFGLIAGIYDRAAQFAINEKFLRYLSPPAEGRLLDAGGGTGRVAAALRGIINGILIADPSIGMLRKATAKGLTAVCTPAEHFPFANGSFDRIVMMDAFHHVFDQKRAANELWRILSPDGRILIIEPDIRRFAVKLIAVIEKLLLMRSHFRSFDEITLYFDHPEANVSVIRDESSVWIVIERVR